jgi:hypothetical protein
MSLLRGIARTAIISSTATAVSNNVSRRQAGRWAEQEQQQRYEQQAAYQPPVQHAPPPAAAPAGGDMQDKITQLKELAQLKEAGILTEAEFDTQKALILGG